MTKVLVLYYSLHGNTRQLARHIGRGIEQVDSCEAVLRTVADISTLTTMAATSQSITTSQPATVSDPIVTHDDLKQCAAIAMGSPVRFGNMAAPLKHFLDSTSGEWLSGTLIDKPACVFTSSSSLHGGQETTLQSMMLPLLHHGMLIVGIPYSEPLLHTTHHGGTPYGASHVNNGTNKQLHPDEIALAQAIGRRLATTACKLNG
ncbi:NAD(P)H:quinone oxidoreductase [Photobacterium iliopiscarium]|jgi:NAD(P)H dehydrogenase (quinone)|uniref:NAD(P)H:quinone oxidoreductase n=2 Tax=Photobacterium iliopiscarium TaxID=56192 RepID=A0A2T3MDB5_9GAMM|nr:Trp operon repressor [Photobacterium iliopiscarium]PST87037.1 NAD(P)H:quinone oxidoreductase [Photobacterium iliopiscarium]PST97876.1 NAD(P)H:quinone oxidoreductase [Photobacterium iliopiscarium]PSV79773.1 NAD(P)H:quinone oxidoreductase [Photobacterium iliopiscarium]PSV91493.1 NAD(P)H:quinone oxidoreductase [Photobacterium iliopiscarium]